MPCEFVTPVVVDEPGGPQRAGVGVGGGPGVGSGVAVGGTRGVGVAVGVEVGVSVGAPPIGVLVGCTVGVGVKKRSRGKQVGLKNPFVAVMLTGTCGSGMFSTLSVPFWHS
jgi:hypothetical protein